MVPDRGLRPHAPSIINEENEMTPHRRSEVCACPQYGRNGVSVAAMEYAETKRWQRSGHFSGTGIGVGIGLGAGLAIGGGTYSERGESRSKRADMFSEPARYALPATAILVVGGLLALAFLKLPSLIEMAIEVPPSGAQGSIGSAMASTGSDLSSALWLLAPMLAFLVFAIGLRRYRQAEAEEARLNTEVLPRRIERYNQLRYCENCHVLFDCDGHGELGSELGFQRMMDSETLAAGDT